MLERKMLSNVNRIYFVVLLSFVALFGATFLGVNYLTVGTIAWIMSVLAVIGIFLYGKMNVDMRLLFLFEAMLLVAVHDDRLYVVYEVKFGWVLVLGYILGKFAVGKDKKTADANIRKSYFAMAFSMFALGIVDLIYTFSSGYISTERLTDIWTKEWYVRTTYELCFILVTASVFWAIVSFKNNKLLAVTIIIAELIILKIVLFYEGRFNLLTLMLSVPMMFVIYVYSEWASFKTGVKKAITYVIIGGVILVVVLAVLFFNNVFGLFDLYANSFLSGSGGILKNERFVCMQQAFEMMPYYPWGGYEPELLGTSHNMWIEYQRHHGTAMFILLECYKLLTIKDVIVLAVRRGKNYKIKYLLVPGFTFLNIYYSMEPNGFANRWFLLFGLFLSGMIRAKLELENMGDYAIGKFEGKALIDVSER